MQSAECAVQAFGGGITSDDLCMPLYTVLAAFDDDNETLMAQIELRTKYNYFCGKRLKTACVGGVATKAQYRRAGCIREIMNYVFNNPDYDFDISILYPFSESYYRKFGYEVAGDCISADVPFSNFGEVERFTDVTLVDDKNIGDVVAMHNRIGEKSHLCFEREDGVYFNSKPFRTSDYTYMVNGEDAYASFSVNRAQKVLSVKEIMFDSPSALRKILGFIRMFDANLNTVHFEKLPVDSPIRLMYSDEKPVAKTVYNVGGIRVLDFKNVLNTKNWHGEGQFSIKINDTIAKNDGCFLVSYNENGCEISDFDGTPDIELSSAAMSKIFLVGCTIDELKYRNGVKINNENPEFFLEFTPITPFFTDGF